MRKDQIQLLIKKHIKLLLLNKKYCSRSTKTKYSQIASELFFVLEDLNRSKLYAKKNLTKRISYYIKSLKYTSKHTLDRKTPLIKELKYVLSKF